MTDRIRVTKADMIAAELRAMIASGEIPRGERLQQDQLAERFRTSITPVREAMKRLEADGMLTIEPHRGVRVSTANVEAIKGIYVSRRLLEPYAAQRAALRVSRQDVAQAYALLERMGDPSEDLNEANRHFHFLFYEKAGIPSLTDTIKTLWWAYPWDILSALDTRRDRAVDEHEAIADAIAGADFDAIATTIADNLRLSYLAVVEHLTGQPAQDPFDPSVD